MTKVFCTGVTGYIGGDLLSVIAKSQPDWEVACLVRSRDKGNKVTAQYPQVRLVFGDLDSIELIEKEAKDADIVYHMASADHEASARAIAKGLASHTSDRPGYWIHVSGTGILSYVDFANNSWGQETSEMFDDWDNVGKVLSIPDSAWHRPIDKIVLQAGKDHPDQVKTAIVCPPTIFGRGRGPDNTRSMQAYELAEADLKLKQGLVIGQGKNIWTEIHVWDLSQLFLLLGQDAAQGGVKATWDDKGYYFVENGEFVWADLAKAIAQSAYEKKLIASPDLKSIPATSEADGQKPTSTDPFEVLSEEEIKKVDPFLRYKLGSNARCKAVRARKLLGWAPKERSLFDEISDIVDSEAASLGLA